MVLILHNFITPIMMSPRGSHIRKSSNHIMRTRMVVAEYLLHSRSAFRELPKLRLVQLFDISTKHCWFLLRNHGTCICPRCSCTSSSSRTYSAFFLLSYASVLVPESAIKSQSLIMSSEDHRDSCLHLPACPISKSE